MQQMQLDAFCGLLIREKRRNMFIVNAPMEWESVATAWANIHAIEAMRCNIKRFYELLDQDFNNAAPAQAFYWRHLHQYVQNPMLFTCLLQRQPRGVYENNLGVLY